MQKEVAECMEYAESYLKSAKSIFSTENRRFDNDLLYNLISICFEKFMVGLLAHHDWIATSHLPLMLYREAVKYEPELGESIRKTAILIGSFEGICSIEDFGYKTPTDEQIEKMLSGLEEVREFIAQRVQL
ncbi:MAG: hypothetical protein R3Y15_04305 [Rikenellaceae bacterium]